MAAFALKSIILWANSESDLDHKGATERTKAFLHTQGSIFQIACVVRLKSQTRILNNEKTNYGYTS